MSALECGIIYFKEITKEIMKSSEFMRVVKTLGDRSKPTFMEVKHMNQIDIGTDRIVIIDSNNDIYNSQNSDIENLLAV